MSIRLHSTWLASVAVITCLTFSACAQSSAPATTGNAPHAPQLPPVNPEAQKAILHYIQALVTALNTQGPLLSSNSFTDSFNAKISAAQLQQVLAQLHGIVGKCRLDGQVDIPISYVGSFLLNCDKGFVPVEMAIEEQAPYRLHSLLIRPNYAKL